MSKSLSTAIIAIVSALVAILALKAPLVQTWELKTYDARVSLATSLLKEKPADVVLFYVDEPSLEHFKEMGISWPWPRELYPTALDLCRRGGAKAVVFDLFYSEPSVYGVADDEAFAKGVASGPPSYFVLFTSEGASDENEIPAAVLKKAAVPVSGAPPSDLPVARSFQSLPISQLIDAAAGFGDAQAKPDMDGIYRRITLLERYDGEMIPSISLKVVADLTGKKLSWDDKGFNIGDWRVPLDDSGRMMIRYFGPTDTFPVYPLAQVLQSAQKLAEGGTPDIDPSVVKDKIVIIGVAAPGLYDLKPMPLSRTYPGPEVHATIIQDLLNREAIRPASSALSIAIIAGTAAIAALGLTLISNVWGIGSLILGLGVIICASAVGLFVKNIWIPVIGPMMSLGLTSFGMVMKNYLTEGRKKREIKRAFSQYLSPAVVKEIAKNPESVRLGGEEGMLTVFFSDIAGFTSISEKTTPAKLVADLNEYLTCVTNIILEHEGTLDKYIGDAVMAFWGAPLAIPDHEAKAALSAIMIQKELVRSRLFATRIGIHTGPVVVGNIGSEQRFNYTAIGDTVNLASRLEGLNKKFGTNMIMSETTCNKAKEQVLVRPIGRVRVKGRTEPIGIYEPLGIKAEMSGKDIDACEAFADCLDKFCKGDFAAAHGRFRAFAEKGDSLAAYYRDLSADHMRTPPKEFDGVITFDTK